QHHINSSGAVTANSFVASGLMDVGSAMVQNALFVSIGGRVQLGRHRQRFDDDVGSTVSIGSTGNERRVTHMAPGAAGTDAVNVDQLNAAITRPSAFISLQAPPR